MMKGISPSEAKRLLDEKNALLVDIREPTEFAAAHIEGARLEPVSVLASLPPAPDKERIAIFHCRSGGRTKTHAQALENRGFATAYYMEGGLAAWEAAGLPVVKQPGSFPMPRQIQIIAGFMVLTFTALSFFLPLFKWFALFVGAGLLFAGISGICFMEKVLSRLPWNNKKCAAKKCSI